jgi:hypothetical protein
MDRRQFNSNAVLAALIMLVQQQAHALSSTT